MTVQQPTGMGRRVTAAPSRARRRARPHDESGQARTRILDAAEQLFAQNGFDGAATAKIARAADVPKGLLFYYFPAKTDILATLLEERLGGMTVDPAPLIVPGDPVHGLLNIAETVLRNHAESDMLREIIWHESHTRTEVRAALTRYRCGLHDAIEQVLHGSLAAAVAESAVHAAASAWAAIVTARPLNGLARGPLHEPGSLRCIAELLCRGLIADPGT